MGTDDRYLVVRQPRETVRVAKSQAEWAEVREANAIIAVLFLMAMLSISVFSFLMIIAKP